MGNQALPRKTLGMLKKVYHYLNKGECASSSGFAKRRFFNAAVAVVALVLLSVFMLSQVMSAILTNMTISNVGTLNVSADIKVYCDASFTNRTSGINWGTLAPGATGSFTIFIRNEGNVALTLSMSTSNWNPTTASNCITMNWNYNGQPVNAGAAVQVTLTLTASPSSTGISNFSFDINLVGSG